MIAANSSRIAGVLLAIFAVACGRRDAPRSVQSGTLVESPNSSPAPAPAPAPAPNPTPAPNSEPAPVAKSSPPPKDPQHLPPYRKEEPAPAPVPAPRVTRRETPAPQPVPAPGPDPVPTIIIPPPKPAPQPAPAPNPDPSTQTVRRPPVPLTPPPNTPDPAPPKPVPAPQPAPAVVARAGVLTWSGVVDKGGSIVIDGSQTSSGSLNGALPGVPVMIDVDAKEFGVAEAPGPGNNWRRLVIRSRNKRHTVITIRWSAIQ